MDFDFQDSNPNNVVLFSALYANYLANRLPFNVQNLLGNILELIGQCLLVYNAQQQFFQGGPGRFYEAKYRDVNNPFCTEQTSESNDAELFSQLEGLLQDICHTAEHTFGFRYNSDRKEVRY